MAVIVPVPEAVIDDASFDILGEIQPRIVEAIGQRVDSAIIFGVNRPAAWPMDIITRARQAGNNVIIGSSPDYYDLIMGENGVIAKVEEGGYMVTGALASMGMRAKLAQDEQNNGRVITAEKVGEYSVSYGDRTKLNQKMLQTLRIYLSQTNLLYRGSGC